MSEFDAAGAMAVNMYIYAGALAYAGWQLRCGLP